MLHAIAGMASACGPQLQQSPLGQRQLTRQTLPPPRNRRRHGLGLPSRLRKLQRPSPSSSPGTRSGSPTPPAPSPDTDSPTAPRKLYHPRRRWHRFPADGQGRPEFTHGFQLTEGCRGFCPKISYCLEARFRICSGSASLQRQNSGSVRERKITFEDCPAPRIPLPLDAPCPRQFHASLFRPRPCRVRRERSPSPFADPSRHSRDR